MRKKPNVDSVTLLRFQYTTASAWAALLNLTTVNHSYQCSRASRLLQLSTWPHPLLPPFPPSTPSRARSRVPDGGGKKKPKDNHFSRPHRCAAIARYIFY